VAGRHIVVAGGGIAGLTAALALSRIGCSVTLCERAPEFSEAGAGIQIAPNAGRLLEALGVGEAVESAATEPGSILMLGGTSHNLRIAIPTARFRERFGMPYRVIHRADLQQILADAVKDSGVDIRFGTEVTDAGRGDLGVTVETRTGDATSRHHAAALVAADGVWSRLRQRLRPDRAEAAPLGRSVWRAMVPVDKTAEFVPAETVGLWLVPDAHAVFYPVRGGESLNLVVIVDERWDHKGWSHADDGTGLKRRAITWPADLRHLIDLPSGWKKFAAATVDPDGVWSDGRVALIGDAAHAMPPFLAQGAAMAIEDAWVLADQLRDADDVAEAFRRYEDARKPRVRRVARESDRAGSIYEMSGGMALARDLALSIGRERLVSARYDWIYAWRPADDEHNG